MPGAVTTAPGSNISTPTAGILVSSSELDQEALLHTPRQADIEPDD